MQKKMLAILGVMVALGMILSACQPADTTQPTPETIIETRIVTEEVVVTEVVTEIVEVEAEIDRKGAWLDTVVMVADPSVESAVARILADDIDVYAQAASNAEAFSTVQNEGLNYVTSVGSYNEITFNPAGPELNDGTINPFAVAAIREAVNLLIDRDFVVQEILGGLGIPKYLPINGVFPDYANFADVARELENQYAYDPEAAGETIAAEMEALGAEMVDGVWGFNGEPLELIFLIRVEDERTQIGDYLANQLEEYADFSVFRDYRTSSEASPLWIQSDPNDGLWHLYTGGWITTAISRDDGDVFQFFYSPRSVYGFTGLWQNYVISDEFDQLAQDLINNNFNSLEERAEMFRDALYLAMESSNRVWVNDSTSFSPFDDDVTVTFDLAGGISGTPLWSHTLRYTGEVGGQMTVAMADLLVEPWNPLAGSNWVYDGMPQNAVSDFGVFPDPYTGLAWPQRIESAQITAVEGLPIGTTYDWVSLEFVPEIEVPGDAWVDWNATDQVFITAEEKLGSMAAMPPMEDDPGSIVDIAVEDGRFTTLVTALQAADLAETLSGEGPFTVFAPTDDAFDALPEGTLEGLLEDIPALTDVLLYHVLGGYAPAEKVLELEAATTLLGKNVEISVEDGNVFVNDAQVIITDIMANNGVIHVIDTVLIPPEGEAGPEIPLVPEVITSKVKSVVTYPADLFETVTWHDGSPLTPADFVMSMILVFDQGYEGSPIFDESQVGAVQSFMNAFKGMKVASTDPLVIEYYSDAYALDAENNVTTFWPQYNYGEGAWHMLALGILAETDGELAFSADKADALEVEWTSYISGPSLEILRAKLDAAISETYIPYEATLGNFISPDEAAERYSNILDWYRIQGHFWVNTGPFYLNKVFPVEKTLTLTRNQDYVDQVGKWDRFGEPQIADVEVDGPGRVTIGEEAVFDAFVTFQGEAYPSDDIKEVKYLVFDATGNLVESANAEMVEEGLYSVTLSSDLTSSLEAGSNKLEVVVVPFVVSVPSFQAFEFVTVE